MTDTNALLSIALGLVANFTNIVEVPPYAVPTSRTDLEKYVAGSPYSPVDAYLVHKRGTEFWIRDGVVQGFESPGSYFHLQDPNLIPRYTGSPAVTSNQAVEFATGIIQRLVKNGNPIANVSPKVIRAPDSGGREVPFYLIGWPSSNSQTSFGYSAKIEVDARKPLVVSVDLRDRAFFDYAFARGISNRVYTPPPPAPPPPAPKRTGRFPKTYELVQAIHGWVGFCRRLGLDLGSQTNVTDVDPQRTFLYKNPYISSTKPVCQVWFRNGTIFEAVGGVAFSHYCSDACFVGAWPQRPEVEWRVFHGRINRRWEDLAEDLEGRIVDGLGIPREMVAPFRPEPQLMPPALGTNDLKRLTVEWWPGPDKNGVRPDSPAFSAEFDLENGDTKSVRFEYRNLIQALGRVKLSDGPPSSGRLP